MPREHWKEEKIAIAGLHVHIFCPNFLLDYPNHSKRLISYILTETKYTRMQRYQQVSVQIELNGRRQDHEYKVFHWHSNGSPVLLE